MLPAGLRGGQLRHRKMPQSSPRGLAAPPRLAEPEASRSVAPSSLRRSRVRRATGPGLAGPLTQPRPSHWVATHWAQAPIPRCCARYLNACIAHLGCTSLIIAPRLRSLTVARSVPSTRNGVRQFSPAREERSSKRKPSRGVQHRCVYTRLGDAGWMDRAPPPRAVRPHASRFALAQAAAKSTCRPPHSAQQNHTEPPLKASGVGACVITALSGARTKAHHLQA